MMYQGNNGGNGGDYPLFGGDGGNGGSGLGLRIDLDGPWYSDGFGWNEDGGIWTYYQYGHGIDALSLGGNGGRGGVGVGIGYTPGGDGGNGGNGGAVTLDLTVGRDNGISTYGKGAQGLYALSQGGNGGNGGDGYGLSYAKGGDGGRGGNGGTVDVSVMCALVTYGDEAHGILAQSLGGASGYGGDGGGVFGGGGSGSDSGKGGTVNVATGNGGIWTFGDDSYGILAQSIGGFVKGGGVGGGIASFGGSDASSGDGGNVAVTNNGRVTTEGSGSHAIVGQSIGGGGGSAGVGGGLLVALGGTGSAGGDGGAVTIDNRGALRTYGSDALGIFAQSIGGGGGAGEGSGGFISLGGSGSSSGDGGSVVVNNSGAVTTSGDYSGSIVAQSIGGGGGRAKIPGGVLASIGGDGASGGDGGDVTVANSGRLETSGLDSTAIFAESIGGGGGTGAGARGYGLGLTLTKGGDSAAGGNGGQVHVDSGSSALLTRGAFSNGIHARSIGGGGGGGGDARSYTGGIQISESIGIGGTGGGGGSADTVDITNGSQITTLGEHAHGLFAQSLGGGGGSGGSVVNWNATIGGMVEEMPGVSLQASLGGTGGEGGAGKAVRVDSTGDISTSGFRSYGILAQSIGGGGGDGGNTMSGAIAFETFSLSMSFGGNGSEGGDGDAVSVTSGGDIATAGDFSYGILGQSIGGGGGSGGNSRTYQVDLSLITKLKDLVPSPASMGAISLGGFGDTGGTGGRVDITNTGSIATQGAFAHGILAQSVGGGGGSGGDVTKIAAGLGEPWELTPFAGYLDISDDSLLGGSGRSAGNGGAVTVRNDGSIATHGPFASGILAQSVGGGGGASGLVVSDEYSLFNPSGSHVRMGGHTAGSGNGGDVTVENTATITTQGAFSHGILAQSVGGGGGFQAISEGAGLSESYLSPEAKGVLVEMADLGMAFAGSVGGSGSAGAVNVAHTGSITTQGDTSHGIFAQSAAGHGGSAGPVTVTVAGSITADGRNSDGIHAQSVGGHGSGNISVDVSGTVRGGSGSGAGVNLDGGVDNILTNRGTISSLSGRAIVGGVGNDVVENYGTVIGGVHLDVGANAFNNNAGARFDTGTTVDLGVGNALTNAGILSPGGLGMAVNTTVVGDLILSASSVIEIEIGGLTPGSFDSLDVTGAIMEAAAGEMGLLSLSSSMGTVHFSFLPGFDPASELGPGQTAMLPFLTSDSGVDWTMLSYEFSGGPSGLQYSVFGQEGGLFLQAAQVVPVPGAVFLAGMGLGLLGWGRRRLRR